MSFKTIKAEEQQKFRDILMQQGFDTADFSLKEETITVKTLPDDTEPKGAITITYRNARSKTYPSATGSVWTQLFEEDLRAGFFQA